MGASAPLLPANLTPTYPFGFAIWRGEELLYYSANSADYAADTALNRSTTTAALRHIWPWASVTKLVTAAAILEAAARSLLNLDDPIDVSLVKMPQPPTLRQLLSHASGLAAAAPRPEKPPLTRRIYSNIGYVLAAQVLATAVGQDFPNWLEAEILSPWGMSDATLATGKMAPAHGMSGSLADLGALGSHLLAAWKQQDSVLGQIGRPQFPGLRGIVPGYGMQTDNLWGAGAEIHGEKSPHWLPASASATTFGHFGVAGSFLWIDPRRDLICAFLGAQPFGPWQQTHWAKLNAWILEHWN